MRSTHLRGRAAALAAGVAAISIGAGAAWGAVPSADDTIRACYRQNDGLLRVIDHEAGQRCRNGEQELTWASGPGAPELADGAVTTPKLADGAVTTEKIAQNTIEDGDIFEVSASKITGLLLPGQIGAGLTGSQISDGTITAADLAGSYVNGLEMVPGAVTSEKIMDGTVEGRDLANGSVTGPQLTDGAVTTGKQTANVASAFGRSQTVAVSPDDTVVSTATLSVPTGTAHQVLVTGQAMVQCTICPTTDPLVVTWTVSDGTTTLGDYSVVLSAASPMAVLPVSGLFQSSGVSSYSLTLSSSAEVQVSNARLTAVDLGR